MAERRPDRVLGAEHNAFWEYCGKGELRFQLCGNCGHVSWPAVPKCEKCGDPRLTWQPVSGRGKVVSWCTFERQYYKEIPIPWDTILVEMEGGPLFISNPKGFKYQDITPDMPVKLAFIDCEDSAGAYRLPVFEKA